MREQREQRERAAILERQREEREERKREKLEQTKRKREERDRFEFEHPGLLDRVVYLERENSDLKQANKLLNATITVLLKQNVDLTQRITLLEDSRASLDSLTHIYDARAVSMAAQHDMTYEAACLLLDEFCAHARTSLPPHDLAAVAALLDTLDTANDCVHEYARLRALADISKWGKEMRFCADTSLRLLAEALAQYAPAIQARPAVQHVPALIRRIQDGLKNLRLADDLAQLALHA
jgi:hypothetical protein